VVASASFWYGSPPSGEHDGSSRPTRGRFAVSLSTKLAAGGARMSVAESQRHAPVRVRVIDTDAEFAALEGAWERLQREAALTSVFQTFDWMYLWWKYYGAGQPLSVLCAYAGEELVGVVPVYVQTVTMLRVPVRMLRFVGSGGDTTPDDLGPFFARGREGEVARILAEALLAIPGWDVLLLTDMDPASPFRAALADAARAAGLKTQSGESERISFMSLPETWEAWLQTLHGDRRYRVKKVRKKLEATHPSRFFVWDDPATLDQGIDRLVFLHHKRWKSAGQDHAFNSPEYVGFHRAVMKACLARDRLRLYTLECAGQAVAIQYFYRFRDTVYLMQSGFDLDFANVKPGEVLLGHIIQDAIREKNKALDFLRGNHSYKDHFATGERHTEFVTAFRNTPGAWAYRTRRLYIPAAKAQLVKLRKRLRPDDAKAT
jgi:CelD/BcsL family acetyltransferase involved in cellulose biosynthesis